MPVSDLWGRAAKFSPIATPKMDLWLSLNLSPLWSTSSPPLVRLSQTHQETCWPVPLKVSLPTSVQLQILQQSSNLAAVPPSHGQGALLPVQGPGRRWAHLCLHSKVCRPQPWLWTQSSPGSQFRALSTIIWIQSCLLRNISSDLTRNPPSYPSGYHLSMHLVKGLQSEDPTSDPEVNPCPSATLLNKVLEIVPFI